MDNQNNEVESAQTTAQEQPQWHAPQLQCFDAKDAEYGGSGHHDNTLDSHSS